LATAWMVRGSVRARFSTPVRLALRPIQPPVHEAPGLFGRGIAAGAWR
jgi:hypothetical protein